VTRTGPRGVDAARHNANVAVRDANGNLLSHERLVSGNMTPTEKALGFPKNTLTKRFAWGQTRDSGFSVLGGAQSDNGEGSKMGTCINCTSIFGTVSLRNLYLSSLSTERNRNVKERTRDPFLTNDHGRLLTAGGVFLCQSFTG